MTASARAVTPALDTEKLNMFAGKAVGEISSAVSAALVVIGDRLGLYRALAENGPVTSHRLAELTNTDERYVREWLANQTAGGYLEYDAAATTYLLPPEHAFMLAEPTSPVYLQGAFQMIAAVFAVEPRITEAFRTGN